MTLRDTPMAACRRRASCAYRESCRSFVGREASAFSRWRGRQLCFRLAGCCARDMPALISMLLSKRRCRPRDSQSRLFASFGGVAAAYSMPLSPRATFDDADEGWRCCGRWMPCWRREARQITHIAREPRPRRRLDASDVQASRRRVPMGLYAFVLMPRWAAWRFAALIAAISADLAQDCDAIRRTAFCVL